MIFLNSARLIAAVHGKAYEIPRGGWNARTFAEHGHGLIMTMTRTAKIVQRRQASELIAGLRSLFTEQLELTISLATSRRAVVFDAGASAALWAQALKDAFTRTGHKLKARVMPSVQSVMAQGYSKTNVLLGEPGQIDSNLAIARRANAVAERITRINDTTREKFERIIRDAIANGLSVQETSEVLRRTFPKIDGSRLLVIARTELSNAWTQGAAQSYRENPSITHLSVIGCESREIERWGQPSYVWLFQGESTCNFEDLEIHDLEAFMEIGFHPQHTGTLVPSGFR